MLIMPKVVIVEDELIAAEYLKEVLASDGFEVVAVIDNGREAQQQIPKIKPDIVLMDIMLKGNISGSEVALNLKHSSPKTAIIFLTAYADREMVEYAIESNSYGYLMKPYNEQEILSTLKVILQRMQEQTKANVGDVDILKIEDNLYFDFILRRLFKHDKEVSLGSKAILLIEMLCKQADSSISFEQISQEVWGEQKSAVTLRTMIHRIKTKTGCDFIQNINGLGYMIQSQK